MKFQRVGVLMGGLSAEREVSLASGAAVADGLSSAGFDVVRIDVGKDLDVRLRESRVDAVFIALHGRWGEDGTVQGMLEIMGVPYTGSPVLASAMAMDKVRTREALSSRGLPVAKGAVARRNDGVDLPPGLTLPLVVKPASEGSSVGVTIVKAPADFPCALETAWACGGHALVEAFIAGAEINVAVLDGQVLGAVEIEPHAEFYSYDAKYAPGGSTHHIPPRLEAKRIEEALEIARRAYEALGCAGAARVDLIVPRSEPTVVLEINTIPGMTPTSLLPEIAAHAGIDFPSLVSRIMEGARLHVGRA